MLITANNGLYNYIPLEQNVCKENLDNCDQICVDTRTSYKCSCNPGYMLHADGYSCTSESNLCNYGNSGISETQH